MRHRVFGRQLKRTKNERRLLFAGLVREVVLRGRIMTTIGRAKAVQPLIEKLVTKARDGSSASQQVLKKHIFDRVVFKQLILDGKTRFATRTSGFTRIVKMGPRRGDAGEVVILEFVDRPVVTGEIVDRRPAQEPAKVKVSQKMETIKPKIKVAKKVKK